MFDEPPKLGGHRGLNAALPNFVTRVYPPECVYFLYIFRRISILYILPSWHRISLMAVVCFAPFHVTDYIFSEKANAKSIISCFCWFAIQASSKWLVFEILAEEVCPNA